MLALLSPSKTLDESPLSTQVAFAEPCLFSESKKLVSELKKLDERALGNLMDISPKLAKLNVERYQSWKTPFTEKTAKPAIYLFKGDVYDGFDVESLPAKKLPFLNQHVAILSGLYGLIRPLDSIMPYRLEMGTSLKNSRGKDLYAFWGDQITHAISAQLQSHKQNIVLNLASQEYFKAVNPKKLDARVITIDFKDKKSGAYKMIGLFAKKARGACARVIVDQEITDPEKLKTCDVAGYRWNKTLSSDDCWVFTRE